MNSPVIKDWLELPEPIVLPLEEINGDSFESKFQVLDVPYLWDIGVR